MWNEFLTTYPSSAVKLLSPLHGDQIQNTVSPYQTDPSIPAVLVIIKDL